MTSTNSNKIKSKAKALADILSNDSAEILASIYVEYTTADDWAIFNELFLDFLEEDRVKEKFKKWLITKSLIQGELF